MTNVQSYIASVSYMTSLEEMKFYVDNDYYIDLEEFFECSGEMSFTAPRWAVKGDVVFFYHTKSAIYKMKHLRAQLKKDNWKYDKYRKQFTELLDFSELFYKALGGSIFAVAKVKGDAHYSDGDEEGNSHWKSRIYAEIEELTMLDKPIYLSEFSNFIEITRQSSITSLCAEQFEKLKETIIAKNGRIKCLEGCFASAIQLKNISENNWIEMSGEYLKKFFLESQFRKFYVDYLLRTIGDKKKFYSECSCYENGKYIGKPDNFILIFGKYLPVEVKLNVRIEKDLKKQLNKYCNIDTAQLEKSKVISSDEIYKGFVFVIDTNKCGVYNYSIGKIEFLCSINDITNINDVLNLRDSIKNYLRGE